MLLHQVRPGRKHKTQSMDSVTNPALEGPGHAACAERWPHVRGVWSAVPPGPQPPWPVHTHDLAQGLWTDACGWGLSESARSCVGCTPDRRRHHCYKRPSPQQLGEAPGAQSPQGTSPRRPQGNGWPARANAMPLGPVGVSGSASPATECVASPKEGGKDTVPLTLQVKPTPLQARSLVPKSWTQPSLGH